MAAQSLSERAGSGRPLNLSNRIYEDIKSRIIEVRLAPDTVLDERTLGEDLGASRTPVREALRRLSLEGWVVWPERRRACVRGITPDDAAEIFSVRDMLEIHAVNAIFDSREPRLLAGQLVPLTNLMREYSGTRIAFIKADMAFHSQVISFTGNSRLCALWERIAGEVMRIAIYTLSRGRKAQAIYNEHEALIQGFWSADRALTIREMRGHHEMIVKAYRDKLEQDTQTA
ncbi:MAG: GntR family transcriptional regulator [Desulfovibrio sp.]|nr:GntR family transcriptional regulator [Desulfovibrio sp.]